MKLVLESKNNINTTTLPNIVDGNYWVTYNNNNLLNVESSEDKWVLKSNNEVKISNSLSLDNLSNINYLDSVILEENKYYYIINIMTKETFTLYSVPGYINYDNFIIDYNQNNNIIIGGESNNDIIIKSDLIKTKELSIEYDKKANQVILTNLNDKESKLFVNNRLCNKCVLNGGDIIFFKGVFVYYFGALLLVSNYNNVSFNSLRLNKRIIKDNEYRDYSNILDKDVKVFDQKQ